ncbi:MAG: RHS repeat-associated core domain-containing protein, partial [Pyrinomonadaceae bacterium]
SYERDANGGDDAMMRRYQSSSSRFNQPDPYDGSYNFTDPQSLNRYAYTQNDPVNFVDPSGLTAEGPTAGSSCNGGRGIWIEDQNNPRQLNCYNVSSVTINPGESFLGGSIWGRVVEAGGGLVDVGGLFQGGLGRRRPPQQPLPTPKPSPHPAPNMSQQKQYDECIKAPTDLYHGRLPGVVGRFIAGGAGLAVGIAVFKGAPSVGFGTNAAARTFASPLTSSSLFLGLMEIHHGASISLPINVLSGQLMVTGFEDMIGNRKAFEAALAGCASRWPLSAH